MIKRPALGSLVIALVLLVGSAGYMLATTHNVDEKPFILSLALLALPFVWFLLWIFVSAIAWWQGLTRGGSAKDD